LQADAPQSFPAIALRQQQIACRRRVPARKMRQFGVKSSDCDIDVKPLYILVDEVSNDDDIPRTPYGSDLVAHIITDLIC
jgi:hypothetical protein